MTNRINSRFGNLKEELNKPEVKTEEKKQEEKKPFFNNFNNATCILYIF